MEALFNKLTRINKNKMSFLDDKPEETLDSTLKALWFVASGNPKSVAEAIGLPLPQLTPGQVDVLNNLIKERITNTPLAHITQRQRFLGIDFICDKRALIPRKETEILGHRALEISMQISKDKNSIKVIDACCGVGNLGLAIAKLNSKASVFETDISQEAVTLARENIKFLGLEKQVKATAGDLFSAVENDEFLNNTDLIVVNPPYISTGKVKQMNPEIAENEPVLAFDGGMFGTKIIQRVIAEAPKFLKENSWLLFEVGLGQGEFIVQLCERSMQYSFVEPLFDDNGKIRAISARK